MHVRADAGAASFQRQARLEEHQAEDVRASTTTADAVAGKSERYAPVPRPKASNGKDKGKDGDEPPAPGSEFEPKSGDSEAVAQWHRRMATKAARAIYKDRAAAAECVMNAQARNRTLLRMRVRGLDKVKCVVRLYALAHDLMRMVALAPQLIGLGTATSAMAPRAV